MITDPAERLFSHIRMEGRKTAGLSGDDLDKYVNWNLKAVVRYLERTNFTSEGMYSTVSCDNPATLQTVYLQSGSRKNVWQL